MENDYKLGRLNASCLSSMMKDNPGKQSLEKGKARDRQVKNVLDVKRKLGSNNKMHSERYPPPHTHTK